MEDLHRIQATSVDDHSSTAKKNELASDGIGFTSRSIRTSCTYNVAVVKKAASSEMNSDTDSTTTTTSTASPSTTTLSDITKPNNIKTNNGFLLSDKSSYVLYTLDCLLSTIWVTLCSILVYKYHELVTVFVVFVSCFIGSGIISFVRKSLFNTPINHCTNPTTKYIIGFIVYTICIVWCILSLLQKLNTMDYYDPNKSVPVLQGQSNYISLSTSAGYLAYDHWYTALYCGAGNNKKQRRQGGQNSRLIEAVTDAIALTMILINLVSIVQQRQLVGVMIEHNTLLLSSTNDQSTYRLNVVSTWLLYKLIRTVIQLKNCVRIRFEEPTNKKYVFEKYTTQQQQNAGLVWNVYGNQYDLSEYVQKHPGGKEAILLGANRKDCTALFQSYHPFTIHTAKRVLAKYQINKIKQQPKTLDPDDTDGLPSNQREQQQLRHNQYYHENDLFYQEICQRVERTLQDVHHINPIKNRTATTFRIVYYITVTIALIGTCYWHCTGSVIGSFLFAVFGWLIGSLGHDSGHFATSHIAYVNDIGVWAMSLLCNPIMWQHQHTYAHHSHTNEYGHDPDLHHFDMLLRVHRNVQYHSLYTNQAQVWYVLFGYTFVCFGTCFWIPWGMMCSGSLYGIVDWTDQNRFWRVIGMYVHFLWYIGLIMITPFFVHKTWLHAIAAVMVHIATSGLLFAFFSQINHLTELCLEHEPLFDDSNNNTSNNKTTIDCSSTNKNKANHTTTLHNQRRHSDTLHSWAAQQIESSNNFCPNSTFWHIVSNGLNLQIEHHLFPGLNHCHLMKIQPTIEQVCIEYGVPYKCYNSWYELMQTTFQWLQRLSIKNDGYDDHTIRAWNDTNNNNNNNKKHM